MEKSSSESSTSRFPLASGPSTFTRVTPTKEPDIYTNQFNQNPSLTTTYPNTISPDYPPMTMQQKTPIMTMSHVLFIIFHVTKNRIYHFIINNSCPWVVRYSKMNVSMIRGTRRIGSRIVIIRRGFSVVPNDIGFRSAGPRQEEATIPSCNLNKRSFSSSQLTTVSSGSGFNSRGRGSRTIVG
jgi:hypothetical protein